MNTGSLCGKNPDIKINEMTKESENPAPVIHQPVHIPKNTSSLCEVDTKSGLKSGVDCSTDIKVQAEKTDIDTLLSEINIACSRTQHMNEEIRQAAQNSQLYIVRSLGATGI